MGYFDYDGRGTAASSPEIVPPEAGFWAHRATADWQRLFSYTQTLRHLGGETVLKPGEPNRSVYIILAGQVAGHGAAGPVRLEEGQAFGIRSFFSGAAVQHGVTASSDLEVARLSRTTLDTIAARHPDFALDLTLELGRLLALGIDA